MDIYVGNLNTSLEEDALLTLFEVFGPVISTTIIKDRETGISKGYGFVKMHNAIDAQRAIDEMGGRAVAGRELVVHEAKPRMENNAPRPRNDYNGSNYGSESNYRNEGNYYRQEQAGGSFRQRTTNTLTEEPRKEEDIPIEVQDQAEYSKNSLDDGLISISFKK